MEELLHQLFEADVLSEDTRKELGEAATKMIAETKEQARKEAEDEVRAEITERWVKEREVLIHAIDSKVSDLYESELKELKEDIEAFRDLDAEYAERLVAAKATLSEQLNDDIASLLVELDKFVGENLNAEFDELKEDIEQVKQIQFGMKMFESFKEVFNYNFVDEDSLQSKLQEASDTIAELQTTVTSLTENNDSLIRESRISQLVSPLNGTQREVMLTLLQTSSTDKLEETYNRFINRVVKEDKGSTTSSEKEDKVLAEGKDKTDLNKESDKSGVVAKTGDTPNTAAETINESKLSEADKAWLKSLTQ